MHYYSQIFEVKQCNIYLILFFFSKINIKMTTINFNLIKQKDLLEYKKQSRLAILNVFLKY